MSLDDINGPYQRKPIDLYDLLPAFNKIKDAERGYKLKALLNIISDQANIIFNDISGLWDDFFIETCKPWVVPYIADLVGNNPLHEVGSGRRVDVAETIKYRRRKGTLAMLEELAGEVTGWGAHVVPFFEDLGWTQNLNHLRYNVTVDPVQLEPIKDPFSVNRVGSVNLRNRNALDLLNGPFDVISHTVDVRAISCWDGWYNIRKIGFFLWRLRSYPMVSANPRKSSSSSSTSSNNYYGFHFSPLGNPSPLFNKPDPKLGEDGLCTEINMPGPIRPLAFYFNKRDYYEPVDVEDYSKSQKSIAICCGHDLNSAKLVPIDKVVCKDLSNWAPPPQDMIAAVDLRLGRIAFASDPEEVSVCYSYGFSADIGGGPYERRNCLADEEKYDWEITVCKRIDPSDKITKCSASTLEQALNDWADPAEGKGNKRSSIIKIADSYTYEEAISNIIIPEGKSLVIQAANQTRPHIWLKGKDNLPGIPKIEGSTGSELILNGLLIEGGIYLNENIEHVTIKHCTFVPGLGLGENGRPIHPDKPSISVHKDNLKLSIEIDHCITGALNLPSGITCLTIKDSIIDSCDHDTTDQAIFSDDRYAISFAESILHSNPNVSLPLKGWGNLEVTGSLDNSYFIKYISGSLYELSDNKSFGDSKYRKILMNSNETRHFGRSDEIADNLKLKEGYELSLKSIQGEAIALELIKNGQPVDSKVLLLQADSTQAQTTYYYSTDAGGLEAGSGKKIITIAVHIQGLESKDEAIIINVDGVLQISDVPVISTPVAHRPGPPTKLERTTIFGPVHVKELTLASETIFMAPSVADRRQTGCVRFSYLPKGSKTPRRYRCQSDLLLEKSAKDLSRELNDAERDEIKEKLRPTFTSVHYGDPGYAQLSIICAKEIRTGAEDGSEMGAFCSLKQPHREDNMRIRLDEYLPFGLEAGFIYVT